MPRKGHGSESEQASAIMGPAGGTVRLTRGIGKGASIVIPPGALPSPVKITMHAAPVPRDLPPGIRPTGPYIDFGPDGLTFIKPVTITLPTVRRSDSVFQRSQHGDWTRVQEASPDPSGQMVAAITHFSGGLPTEVCGAPPEPTAIAGQPGFDWPDETIDLDFQGPEPSNPIAPTQGLFSPELPKLASQSSRSQSAQFIYDALSTGEGFQTVAYSVGQKDLIRSIVS